MKTILLFVGFTAMLYVAGLVVHFTMNMLRTALSTAFASRRLSEPSDADPVRRQWFPRWLPAPAPAVWFASGLATVAARYAIRVWWPVLAGALILTYRASR